jgi:hypothetical protein
VELECLWSEASPRNDVVDMCQMPSSRLSGIILLLFRLAAAGPCDQDGGRCR